jgi:hypothetical protein
MPEVICIEIARYAIKPNVAFDSIKNAKTTQKIKYLGES